MRKKSFKAVFWLFMSQIGTSTIAAIFSLLITRTLSPAIYGSFAAINIIYVFIELPINNAFNKVLIKKRNISSKLLKHICYLIVIVGLFLVASISFFTLFFWHEISYFFVSLIVGFAFIINCVASVFISVLQRNLLMKRIAQKNIIISLASGAICLILATFGFGVYALAFQIFLASVLSFVIAINQSPLKFSAFPFDLNWQYSLKILNQAKIYIPVQLLSTANRESLRIAVGLTLGTNSLGLITGAQKVITIIQSLVSSTVNKSSFPIICELIRNHDQNFGPRYLKVISLSIITLTFSFLFAWLTIGEVIEIILGSKWIPIVSIMPALLLSGWATSIGWFNNQTMYAISQEKMQISFGILRLIIACIYLFISSAFGLNAMCFSGAVRSAIVDPFQVKFLTGKISIRLKSYVLSILPSLFSALLVIVIFSQLIDYFASLNLLLRFFVKSLLVALIFFGTVFVTDINLRQTVIIFSRDILRKTSLHKG